MNPRPLPCEGSDLPTDLHALWVVDLPGCLESDACSLILESRVEGHVHHAVSTRQSMAGGESIEVAPHDIAIIVGAIGLVGAIVIAMFALPEAIDFDSEGGVVDARSVTVGILGSNDEIRITTQAMCTEVNQSCKIQSVRVLDEDGQTITSATMEDSEGVQSAEVEIEEGGTYDIELTGTGVHKVEVKVVRQLPIQFFPPIISMLAMVWGVWRRLQEPESGDRDLQEVISRE